MTAARHNLSDSTTERGLEAFAALAVAQTAGSPASMTRNGRGPGPSASGTRDCLPGTRNGQGPLGDGMPQGPLGDGDIVAGRYVIERHVSSGSFGFVYKASDLSIAHHAVALKLLRKPAGSESERQTALRELQLLASVSHPSVVQFKDYGWLDGRLWFSMPWYDGVTLQERLAGENLNRKQARLIFERLAFGLAAMHDVGIHHHDIKPDNIFVANVAGFEEGLPVLLDLGVAAKSGETPTGFTAEYVAPETAAAALGVERYAIGPAADVFALALTLRNCLEPETAPASAGSPLPMLNQRANWAIDPPSRREFRYLAPSFRRWLSLNPADRPTAAEFARELAILTVPEERRESRRRMLLRTAPMLLLLGGAVAALGYRVDQQKTQLDLQRLQLTARQRETERLREESDHNLNRIESQLQRMGRKDAQLRNTAAIARALDRRLSIAEHGLKATGRELDEVKQAQAELSAAHDALTVDRDELLEKQVALDEERAALTTQVAELQDAHGQLTAAMEAAQAQQVETQLERDQLRERALIAEQELQQLRGRNSYLEEERREHAAQQLRTSEALEKLSQERHQLVLREQVLRARLMELEGSGEGEPLGVALPPLVPLPEPAPQASDPNSSEATPAQPPSTAAEEASAVEQPTPGRADALPATPGRADALPAPSAPRAPGA